MVFRPENFNGSDSDRLQAAVDAAAAAGGGKVVIPPRVPDDAGRRTHWLLDRALRVPSDITLVLDNCTLKLSDRCRDNLVRSANCGVGVREVRPLHNIHIVGEGRAVLAGADRPRASGDAANTLSVEAELTPGAPYTRISYGTDAGKPGEKQTGDWRNIGLLLAAVEGFSLRNLTLVDAHSWAVSLERCSFGTIRDLAFAADGCKHIDGACRPMRNQDGLDLRQGCHDITIDGITGHSGDDLVALTAIRKPGMGAGTLDSHMVSGLEPDGERDHVHNIIIRNIRGVAGGHQLVRFLNTGGVAMHTILLDGVIDTAPADRPDRAVVVIGDSNPAWGGVTPLGDTYGFMISNVRGRARDLVEIRGSLCDSVLTNLLYTPEQGAAVRYTSGREYARNVAVSQTVCLRQPAPASACPPRAAARRPLTEAPRRAAFIGAHPDDAEVCGGGLALLYRDLGWEVLFVALTDGSMGHHRDAPGLLRARRLEETRCVAERFGIEYAVMDHTDGSLQAGLEERGELIRRLRRFSPRVVFTHPGVDYHPDHRYTAQLTGDAAFLLRVPHVCPDVPALDYEPVQACYFPAWRYPGLPGGFSVAVSIDDVWGRKLEMLACHASQFFEWLPWLDGTDPDRLPRDPDGRLAALDAARGPHARLAAACARERLRDLYGDAAGRAVTRAEVFVPAPYPGFLTADNYRAVFPFFA